MIVLDASQGELADLIQFAGSTSRNLLEQRLSSADQERMPARRPPRGMRRPMAAARPRRPIAVTERPDREELSRSIAPAST